MTLSELRAVWAKRRDEWRGLGVHVDGARIAEQILEQLDQLFNANSDTVSLAEAASITGLSADHLGRLIRRNQLPNAGRKHAPRIPRVALEPLGRKITTMNSGERSPAGAALPPAGLVAYNPIADARSLLRRRAPGDSHGA
jgi:hypothetical protein